MHNHHWTNGQTVWPRVQAPDNRIHTVYIFTYQIPNPRTMWDITIIVQYIAWLGRDKQDRERLSVFACGPWRVRRGPCDLRVVTKERYARIAWDTPVSARAQPGERSVGESRGGREHRDCGRHTWAGDLSIVHNRVKV
jgi:hypothetical protein